MQNNISKRQQFIQEFTKQNLLLEEQIKEIRKLFERRMIHKSEYKIAYPKESNCKYSSI